MHDNAKNEILIAKPTGLRSAVHGNWVDSTRIDKVKEYKVQDVPELYSHIPTVKLDIVDDGKVGL